MTRKLARAIIAAVMTAACAPAATALEAAHFASASKLATGTWVKLTVAEAGMYEITADELSEMGFSSVNSVTVFGRKSTQITENLDGVDFDDLEQVPAVVYGDKLCFYGDNTYSRTINIYSGEPFIKNTANSYSSYSYYFLTDNSEYSALEPAQAVTPATLADTLTTSYGEISHEQELCSPGKTGKTLLGEDFDGSGELSVSVTMPNYIDSTTINFYTPMAAKASSRVTLSATLNGAEASYVGVTNKVTSSTSEYIYYNTVTGRGTATPSDVTDGQITFDFSLSCSGDIVLARLDAIYAAYQQTNTLAADSAQLRMFFVAPDTTDVVYVEGASSACYAWNVTSDTTYTSYSLSAYGDGACFAPYCSGSYCEMIVFDPTRTLKKPKAWATVENQNLHGMEIPDMVIVTQPGLKSYAQQVADMHIQNDGMDVEVIEQEKIFNEFSMGAPDPMALRLFSKMLYCRDTVEGKFKYLLLFGGGTYDNRHLTSTRSDNLLITYQSTNSSDETSSYTCDNFFGMLGDNAGSTISKIPATIAVGRISAITEEDARIATEKLTGYVNSPELGQWRNRILVSADEGDSQIHMYQAEGAINLIADSTSFCPIYTRAYVEAFELDENDYCVEGQQHIIAELSRGVLFMTYSGHGGHKYLGKTAHIWGSEVVRSTEYEYLPFITFSTCDVARFDSDERGVAEEMFFKEDGGLVACVASARTVYVSENDYLNRAIIKALFNVDSLGVQPTIGEAFRDGFNVYGTTANINKLNYQLFGDPAMKINYPLNLAKVTSIGGVDISDGSTTATVSPMTEVTVAGEILDLDGNLDTDFDGDIIVTLLDKELFFETFTTYSPEIDSYQQRDELSHADGRVSAGKFEVSILVPSQCLAYNEAGLLSVVARLDSSSYYVGGQTEQVVIGAYDEDVAIADTQAPEIVAMYLNDETFSSGDAVYVDPDLHVEITDDYGICSSTSAVAGALKLTLDNGATSYSNARNIVNLSESGRSATIDMTITDLAYGSHSLTLSVCDYAGNCSTRTIDFFVKSTAAEAEIETESESARESATFTISHDFTDTPTATIIVINSNGETVMRAEFTGTTYVWDLNGTGGSRVASGLYRYYGLLECGGEYASTPMKTLVVLDQ